MQVTMLFALFGSFQLFVTEPAQFAYVNGFAFFPDLIYHYIHQEKTGFRLKICFTSKYQIRNI